MSNEQEGSRFNLGLMSIFIILVVAIFLCILCGFISAISRGFVYCTDSLKHPICEYK